MVLLVLVLYLVYYLNVQSILCMNKIKNLMNFKTNFIHFVQNHFASGLVVILTYSKWNHSKRH